MGVGIFECLIWVSSLFCMVCVVLGYVPEDSYLIDCGSPSNNSVGDRVFSADVSDSGVLSTLQDVFVNGSIDSISSAYDGVLYQTARVFLGTSHYTFSIKKHGRHLIRLYFHPFVHGSYNLSVAKFSVSAQNFTLLKDYQQDNGSLIKEYCLNVTSDGLVLTFTPTNSFAFINALEVISLPEELIPEGADMAGSQGSYQQLWEQALETVVRVNMGAVIVSPINDTLWRLWVSDDTYLRHNGLATFVSNIQAVNFTVGRLTENIAPSSVYGTATTLNSELDPRTNVNVTWMFDVDPGFLYLVRFHLCDIVSVPPQKLSFNVYINSGLVFENLDLDNLAAPHFMDVITRATDSIMLNVTVGPSTVASYPNGILNGLEIMKISNPRGSLDALDSELPSSKSSFRMKISMIVGLAVGVSIAIVMAIVLLFMMCRRRSKLAAHVNHSKPGDHFVTNGRENLHTVGRKYSNGDAIISSSKIWYRFPFKVVQEATDNFSENLLIGVGGFGKVYKGVLKDETKVAVKRGVPQSHQGLAEFRTEIEMISQFRHRHLLSLIGYCDEQNEMIIIYEYMENGTLKNHLYGSNLPSLSWKQRLEICIGSARGLHYLHTGSAKAIIHRDVKSANILLDENFMAKVADFGLSKTGPEIDKTYVSTAVKGSFGYLDPEYLTRQQLTEKSDVYSFGVVIFEILCGRAVIDPSLPNEKVNLVEWALKWQKRGQLEEIIDPHLAGQLKPVSLKKIGEIAEKCLAQCGVDRPSMGDVLWNLEYVRQLQDNSERSYNQISTGYLDTSDSTIHFSTASGSEFSADSMSKIFAQMVREEMT